MLKNTASVSFFFFNSKGEKARKGKIVRFTKNGLVFKTDSLLNQDSNLFLRIENPPADSRDIRTTTLAKVVDCMALPEDIKPPYVPDINRQPEMLDGAV